MPSRMGIIISLRLYLSSLVCVWEKISLLVKKENNRKQRATEVDFIKAD